MLGNLSQMSFAALDWKIMIARKIWEEDFVQPLFLYVVHLEGRLPSVIQVFRSDQEKIRQLLKYPLSTCVIYEQTLRISHILKR